MSEFDPARAVKQSNQHWDEVIEELRRKETGADLIATFEAMRAISAQIAALTSLVLESSQRLADLIQSQRRPPSVSEFVSGLFSPTEDWNPSEDG